MHDIKAGEPIHAPLPGALGGARGQFVVTKMDSQTMTIEPLAKEVRVVECGLGTVFIDHPRSGLSEPVRLGWYQGYELYEGPPPRPELIPPGHLTPESLRLLSSGFCR